jgi:hypothetical protein
MAYSQLKPPRNSISDIPLQRMNQSQTSTIHLSEDLTRQLDYWPTSPKSVKPTVVAIASDLGVDFVLLGLSIVFLAFALIVNHYDQAAIAQNPRATEVLLNAIKYVSQQNIASRCLPRRIVLY